MSLALFCQSVADVQSPSFRGEAEDGISQNLAEKLSDAECPFFGISRWVPLLHNVMFVVSPDFDFAF